MGMYTEFHFNARLHRDTPDVVLAIIDYMAKKGGDEETDMPDFLPSHRLFSTRGWEWMLVGGAYFPADPHTTFRYDTHYSYWRLCIRCGLKNYDDEIGAFVDWIRPHLYDEGPTDQFLGFSRYEESREPTLIFRRAASPTAIEVRAL